MQTQAPPTHCCPAAHGALLPHMQVPPKQVSAAIPQLVQVPPPVPQEETLGVRHVFPLQQPLPQDVALQTQTPAMHRTPFPQPVPSMTGEYWHCPVTQWFSVQAFKSSHWPSPVQAGVPMQKLATHWSLAVQANPSLQAPVQAGPKSSEKKPLPPEGVAASTTR